MGISSKRRFAGAADAPQVAADRCNDDFVSIPLQSTVGEAITLVRREAKKGSILYLYVTDADEKLRGIVPIRNLLLADDDDIVAKIMSENVVFLSAETPLPDVYRVFSQSRFLSLPVVRESGEIVGVVHAHSLLEGDGKSVHHLFEERSRGELFELLGIKAEDETATPVKVVFGRLPWLGVNLLGGIICAVLIHFWGSQLPNAVELLEFVPILLVVSESLGMQTASMVVAFLNRSSSKSSIFSIVVKECYIASLVGICAALILGTVILLWTRSGGLALTVAITIAFASFSVAALASAIPQLFRKMKIDPRIAAGPVILALSDAFTLALFLSIARVLAR